jgi:hypothetical protein
LPKQHGATTKVKIYSISMALSQQNTEHWRRVGAEWKTKQSRLKNVDRW